MERDLRFIRKQRAEKDRANEVMTEPSPLQELDVPIANDSTRLPDATAVDNAGENLEASGIWNDLAPDRLAEELKETDAAGAENESHEAISTEHNMPQDSENSMGLAITIPSSDTNEVSERPKSAEKSAESVAPTDAPLEAPLEISDAVDLDFESMLNDTDPKTIDDALNFDFELPTDPAMTQDILNSTDFGDVNMSNTEVSNLPNNTNEDIDSLLPGVENYLNTDTDFSNITIPPATTTPATSQPSVMGTTVTSAPSTVGAAITDTSFDDNFFGLGNFEMDETGGDELGDGTLGDFEDFDWS